MAEQAGDKKKSKLPLIIIAAVVLIGGGAGAYFMMGSKSSGSHGEAAKTEHAAPKKEEAAPAHGGGGEGGAAAEIGEIVTMNEIVVNPKNTRGTRFFVTSLGIVCTTKAQADEVKKKEPLLRDRLLLFFSLQTLEVLSDISRREQIKAYVKAIVDREVATGPVKEVLFARYIVQ